MIATVRGMRKHVHSYPVLHTFEALGVDIGLFIGFGQTMYRYAPRSYRSGN